MTTHDEIRALAALHLRLTSGETDVLLPVVAVLLADLIERRQHAAAETQALGLLGECRVDAYRVGVRQRVRLTHLPTGCCVDSTTVDVALDELAKVIRIMEERYRGEPATAVASAYGGGPASGPVR